jgi:DNA-binding CsgD family transcriptional regulator
MRDLAPNSKSVDISRFKSDGNADHRRKSRNPRSEGSVPREDCKEARLVAAARKASIAGDSERALVLYEATYAQSRASGSYSIAADALFNAARAAREFGETDASFDFVQLLLELTEKQANSARLKAYFALGHHLSNAGGAADVLRALRDSESVFETSSVSDLCEFLELHACASAMRGDSSQARNQFDTLLEISERTETASSQVSRTTTAATNAVTLGQIDRAMQLHKHSLELARQHGLGWRIAHSALTQAWTSLCAGDLRKSRALFELAQSSPNSHFYVRYCRSAVGVLLGTLTQDECLVERCLDFGALDLALKSKVPQRIGPVAAAVYEYFRSHNQAAKAADHLSTSIRAIDNPDECWWLLLQAATCGTAADVEYALLVLRECPDDFPLAYAHRLLLHARLACLDDRIYSCLNLASEAADILGSLRWRYHHAAALELAHRFAEAGHIFDEIGVRQSQRGSPALEHLGSTTLSAREWEIARLVMEGRTNRQIATQLGMAERTVKYHLKGAFDKLGCQNRDELKASFLSTQRDSDR